MSNFVSNDNVMKQVGDKMEYSEERVRDLMRAHDEYIENCRYIRMNELYRTIVNRPSRRFWVSDIRASLVIAKIMKGEDVLEGMWPTKKEMFLEIYRRVLDLQKEYPDKKISELCAMVVEQPAPKFYLAANSAKIMISKYRKQWRKEKQKRLRLL